MIYPDLLGYPRTTTSLILGYEPLTREQRRKKHKVAYGTKRQLPKRRRSFKGGHNKDRYHNRNRYAQ